ncbi:hypothetical protein [Paenibacillus sp. P13VS]|uniref:hypothetical protein n=1 Tax=Paenibacillus sp. P13VS TaxID=2697367 RepID=UPI00187B6E7D|nr:hypothetical protein [Paenibacillus sp. P13VS]MBE7681687.1 hypothetical protein [Paenibacillus sp. P13VS]
MTGADDVSPVHLIGRPWQQAPPTTACRLEESPFDTPACISLTIHSLSPVMFVSLSAYRVQEPLRDLGVWECGMCLPIWGSW